jgi:hypothetical protein
MGHRTALLIVLMLAPLGTGRGEVVSGRVFLDVNGNGRMDANETGIQGVGITDGVSFTVTGADGSYQIDANTDGLLPVGAQPILTMGFPSGTWPTAGWFRRMEGLKGLAKADFGLRRDEL